MAQPGATYDSLRQAGLLALQESRWRFHSNPELDDTADTGYISNFNSDLACRLGLERAYSIIAGLMAMHITGPGVYPIRRAEIITRRGVVEGYERCEITLSEKMIEKLLKMVPDMDVESPDRTAGRARG